MNSDPVIRWGHNHPVLGWGIDVEIDADGNYQQAYDLLEEEEIAGERVQLALSDGPFDGRYALWNKYTTIFVALFGDELASYIQARSTVDFAQASADVYLFIGVSKLWGPRRKLKLVR